MVEDTDGSLWIGTSNGLTVWHADQGGFRHVYLSGGGVQESVNPLLDLAEVSNTRHDRNDIMNIFADITPFRGLNYRINASREQWVVQERTAAQPQVQRCRRLVRSRTYPRPAGAPGLHRHCQPHGQLQSRPPEEVRRKIRISRMAGIPV